MLEKRKVGCGRLGLGEDIFQRNLLICVDGVDHLLLIKRIGNDFRIMLFAQASDRLISIQLRERNLLDGNGVVRTFHHIRSGKCACVGHK